MKDLWLLLGKSFDLSMRVSAEAKVVQDTIEGIVDNVVEDHLFLSL
jgi:hypothetical protein